MTREQQLRKYTMNIYLSLTLTLLISVLLSIVILRSRQVVIEEPRVATFSYTNIEEIEDIKPKPKPVYEVELNENEIEYISKVVWGETHGALSKTEMSGVIWCILNRVDDTGEGIIATVTRHGQFCYHYDAPVTDEIRTLAIDVLTRWQIEKQGASESEVCRTLPSDYLWFTGDGSHNYFRNGFNSKTYWDWSLPNPYGD